VGVVLPLVLGVTSDAQPVRPSANVVLLDKRGHVLGPNPVLGHRWPVTVVATGFASNGRVRIRSGTATAIAVQIASAAGEVRMTFQLSAVVPAGQYLMALTGIDLPPLAPRGNQAGRQLIATVPPVAIVPYRVRAEFNTDAPSLLQSHSGGGKHGLTGAQTLALLAAGAFLVGMGATATAVTHRRRR
jgi:hypothetical protein